MLRARLAITPPCRQRTLRCAAPARCLHAV